MSQVPVLPVRDVVIFPGVIAPLFVGRPRSLRGIEDASLNDRELLIVAQRDNSSEDPRPEDLYSMGTLCRVMQMVRIPDGSTKVLIEGNSRARVDGYIMTGDFLSADVTQVTFDDDLSSRSEPLRRAVLEQFERYVNLHPKLPIEIAFSLANVEDVFLFADIIASHIQVKISEKQELLELINPESRLDRLLRMLIRETELLEMEHSIHDKVRREIEKNNKEYYLKEQLKAIQAELGQPDPTNEYDDLLLRIKKSKMPRDVEKKAITELERLAKMPQMSAEATVSRTYIEWLVDVPWKKRSKDRLDIGIARQVLDEDHYGLDEVKERIIEFLAVQRMSRNEARRGQVLCFVGPPGVGKTSLGKSIARALNRKFVNFSLGGMRDEAEIRGHRRTYIGSLPGRIIQKLKQAGVKNPVMLMDEIDKVGTDFRGDPSSALLEVLDPEQNNSFTDHFLEAPYDLSQVMFITTANVTHTIPKPLLDRMEMISIPGYVVEEKMHIAERHLLPKVLKDNGLSRIKVTIHERVIRKIITEYTREAGVRDLDRQLSKIARKLAAKIVHDYEDGSKPPRSVSVPLTSVKKYLGAPKLHDARLPRKNSVGAALGLAWTESGGDVLVIETVAMKGSGKVLFTGNLGDIMQESAQTALGYIRSCASKYNLGSVEWDKMDIHVHVPEGAIPKDGPSAGVTLALSMLSALTDRAIRSDIAMTGEVTLRGTVLPIGGVREKILAAKRNGINTVILPKENGVDVDELAEWARDGMMFHYVSGVSEVFNLALLKDAGDGGKKD
ncbi:MAG: endopeptidase La [Synergistaceae bacterium]|jgi:ATP-dependent Lon protease|nr:endopeptidase La [Synergistaceae bacterium]